MNAHPPSDDDANAIITDSARNKDLGEVCAEGAAAAGVEAGKIRLLYGRPGRGGFGLCHIEEPDRPKAIKGRGYENCKAYVFDVAAKWTHLHTGDNGRVTIATECTGGFNALVLHWQDGFWSVVTALPYRRPKEALVFQKKRSDVSEPRPALAARPRFETLTLPKPKGP